MDPATLAQIAATHPLVKTVESGEEPTGPAAEAIRRQVESLLAIDMEDPELHEAMDVVADLWKSKGMGNTAENRRNLRSDLERQAVERCEDFVRQMAPMRDMLRQAEANADLLDKQAQESVEDLERTDAETRRVVAAHEQLLATRDQLQREHDAAGIPRYELSRMRRRPSRRAASTRSAAATRTRSSARWNAPSGGGDVRRALAAPDAAKAGRSTSSCPRDEAEALLAKLDGRRPRPAALEFAASSLGRGAATARRRPGARRKPRRRTRGTR